MRKTRQNGGREKKRESGKNGDERTERDKVSRGVAENKCEALPPFTGVTLCQGLARDGRNSWKHRGIG